MLLNDLDSASASSHVVNALADPGYQFLPAASTLLLLGGRKALADWSGFAASWDRLPLDAYMADAGRYRRRRHARYSADGGDIQRAPHRAHFQESTYNPLNGGVERWYEAIDDAIANGASLGAILRSCREVFGAARPDVRRWDIEVHQFRIEASTGAPGQPTPEGMHRDGVDYVLVLLIARHNVASGTTIIGAGSGVSHGSFTLTAPFDAMMLDDHRVFHGVTAIEPIDPERIAQRDVLVVTFRINDAQPMP